MEFLDGAAESRNLNGDEIVALRDGNKKILELKDLAVHDLQLKAKISWLTAGDENCSFYHNYLKIKNWKNNIHGLMVNAC